MAQVIAWLQFRPLGWNGCRFATCARMHADIQRARPEGLSDPHWVLHEYYHVIYQWEPHPGRFLLRYVWEGLENFGNHDAIPAEQEADAFASANEIILQNCLQ